MIYITGTLNGDELKIPCSLASIAVEDNETPYTINLAPINLGTPVDNDIISAIEYAINNLHFYKDQRTVSYDDTASYLIDWELKVTKPANNDAEKAFTTIWDNIKSEHTLN